MSRRGAAGRRGYARKTRESAAQQPALPPAGMSQASIARLETPLFACACKHNHRTVGSDIRYHPILIDVVDVTFALRFRFNVRRPGSRMGCVLLHPVNHQLARMKCRTRVIHNSRTSLSALPSLEYHKGCGNSYPCNQHHPAGTTNRYTFMLAVLGGVLKSILIRQGRNIWIDKLFWTVSPLRDRDSSSSPAMMTEDELLASSGQRRETQIAVRPRAPSSEAFFPARRGSF